MKTYLALLCLFCSTIMLSQEIVPIGEIAEVEEVEEEIIDVPFSVLEKMLVYPGCKGNRNEKRDCFNTNVKDFIVANIDKSVLNELGYEVGKEIRIFASFKIMKDGTISELIKVRAPHPRLKLKTIEAIRLLPKIEPGQQRGKKVNVPYSVGIKLEVEKDSGKK